MATHCAHLLLIMIIFFCYFMCSLGTWSISFLPSDILARLDFHDQSLKTASTDFGNLVREKPSAVLYPSSINDIIDLIKFSNNCSTPIGVSARGCGHSVRGQAMARGGVVVDMASLRDNGGFGIRVSSDPLLGYYYADVGGEQLWIDVLQATLKYGLAPVSWTDYLYLSVGGTLSNAGISGQSFLHGPQISNVLELDVITGKGEFVTCSHHINSELFFAVLGGFGQFGIITRARINLHMAPTRAKWIRLLYSDFTRFTSDQEHLISSRCKAGPDYVEGSLITHSSPSNNWRSSSFYTPLDHSRITSMLQTNTLLYSIELVKYYDHSTANTVKQDVEELMKNLNFIPGFMFEKDVGFTDFLARVKNQDQDDEQTHPWLNIFVPKSRILDFNAGVLVDIIGRHNLTSGPILFYPFNRNKWDYRMSAVTPDEDTFYTLGLLHSSSSQQETRYLDEMNRKIIGFCERTGMEIKQYIPYYQSKEDWMKKHFGPKWKAFQDRKNRFDPNMILSPGQRIFSNHKSSSDV